MTLFQQTEKKSKTRFVLISGICFTALFTLFIPHALSQNTGTPDRLKFPPSYKKNEDSSIIWGSQSPGKELEFYLFEDFESNLQWINPRAAAVSHEHRFVYLNPLNDKKAKKEQKEKYQSDLDKLIRSAEIHWRAKPKKQSLSYEVRCFFIRPGKDKVVLQPHHGTLGKFRVEGLPKVFSLWVKSSGKRHKLYAIFSNYTGRKLPVSLGNLDFEGWLRLEQVIPKSLIKRNPKNANRHEITFEGLKIQSHKSEESGLFIVVFDLMMLTLNKNQDEYPGAQMKDRF